MTTTTTTPANVAGAAVQGLEPPDLAAVADVVPTVLPLHLMVTATAAVSDFNAPSNPRNQEHRDVMLRDLVVRRLTFQLYDCCLRIKFKMFWGCCKHL